MILFKYHWFILICRCCLTLDAMSIKQKMDYDQHKNKVVGFVDLGIGDGSDTEAKEVLVFLIVGLRGHWKCPVSFHFTRGLTAAVQKELLLHCVDALHDIGLRVVSITMDGHSTNIGMAKMLGCNLNCIDGNFSTSFIHGERIFVMLDACHMLKLLRNTLQAYGTIVSPTGHIVWQLLRELNSTQEDLGVRLGNKLTSDHINFHTKKMKVSLAVQTFSSSVASALEMLLNMGIAKFCYASATVEFIKVNVLLFIMICIQLYNVVIMWSMTLI